MDTIPHNETVLKSELKAKGINTLDPVVQFYLTKARDLRASLSTEDERVRHEIWGSNDLKYSSSSIFFTEFPGATAQEHTSLKAIFLSKKGITAILEATGNGTKNGYEEWLIMAYIAAKQSERRLRTILSRVYGPLLLNVFAKMERIGHAALATDSFTAGPNASDEDDDCDSPYTWDDLLAAANGEYIPTPLPPRRDTTAILQYLLNFKLETEQNLQ